MSTQSGAAPRKKATKKTTTAGSASRNGAPPGTTRSTGRGRTPRIASAMPPEAAAPPPAADEPIKRNKRLTAEDLADFRKQLLTKRAELFGDVQHMQNEALHTGSDSGNLSSVPVHMADISTDRWEQSFTLSLMESERKLLREIDAALERIRRGDYGVCEATGKLITKRRLRAKPWARFCIEYAIEREQGRR